jgi:hypothetical protein
MENTGKSRKEFLKDIKFIIFQIHVKFNINAKYITRRFKDQGYFSRGKRAQ